MKPKTVWQLPTRPPEVAEDSLATTLRKYQLECRRSIYQLSNASGVDSAYIWRITRGERVNVSREVLMRLSLALALESSQAKRVFEVANELLDAAGFKGLH